MQETPTIQQAVRALAGVCDGALKRDDQGFNGRDTRFGQSLAAIPHDDWSIRQLATAHKMLATYRGQLAGFGIDYAALRAPDAEVAIQKAAWAARRQATEASTTVAGPKVANKIVRDTVKTGRFLVTFEYNGSLIASLKALGLKAFKADNGQWTWPVYDDKAPKVAHLFAGFEGVELFEALAAKKAANQEASRAASGVEIDLPGLNGKLLPFQVAGIRYAVENKRVFIADEMGLGKTLQGLATVEALAAYPAVFVVPASLKINWLREAAKWFPARRFEVLDGRNAVPSGKAEGYIVNYELLRATSVKEGQRTRLVPTGLAARLADLGLKALVADESHKVKDKKAAQSKGVKALAQGVDVRLLLTGTPIKNRPIELAHQLDVLGRLGEFGGFLNFAKRFANAHQTRFGWDFTGSSNLGELNERLRSSCYVRRLKADVLPELPPLRETKVYLPIDNEVEYRRAEADFVEWLRATAGNEKAAAASRAEQLVRVNGLRQLAVKGKLAAIKAWVEDGFVAQDKKLVLFAHHLSAQTLLRDEFQAPAIRGDMTREAIEADKARFADGDATVIVCSLLAGGVGHTLHANGKCSSVALGELGWTPADVEQAAARVHRIGQTAESVDAYWLLGIGTIDETMAEMIEAKAEVIAKAAGDDKARLRNESIEDAILNGFRRKAGLGE
jgi:SNF2 family DNA or RNA helicase